MNDISSNQSEQGMPETPGKLLRQYREQQELSVEDIYKRIHLEPKIINAIEADDYSSIPTATYARGYLRSYAKTLGLDADHIVSLYDEDNAPPPPEILPEVKPPSQVSSSDKPVKAFTYLISLGLVLLLLIWYQSNFVVDSEQGDDADKAAIEKSVPTMINNTDTTFQVVIHPEGWQSPKPSAAEPLQDALPDPYTSDATDAEAVSSEPERSNNTVQTLQMDNLNLESSAPAQTQTAGTSGPDTVLLTISQDSWIEIYDANDQRLFMDLGREGEQFQIDGTAPFNLILGYSPGVSIKFNDEAFDPEPYSNNGVARFRLPAE